MFLGPMTKNESIYVIVDFFCMLWKLIKKKTYDEKTEEGNYMAPRRILFGMK